MKVDWFTVIVQIVNFLILVWLLKKFLYKPVLNAMGMREQRIAEQLEKAHRKSKQAEKEKEKYLNLQQEVQDTAQKKIQQAKQETEVFRKKLIADAKEEAAAKRRQFLEAVENEKDIFLEKTSRNIANQFNHFATSLMRDLADTTLEENIVPVFLRELSKLPAHDCNSIRKQLSIQSKPVLVATVFELTDTLKEQIKEKIHLLVGEEATIQFIRDERLIAGISMEAGGKKIQWDINHYMEEFRTALNISLDTQVLS